MSNLAPGIVRHNNNNNDETQKFQTQMGHISRHSVVFFVGTVFRLGSGYLFKVYLARALGPEPLGIYTLGMTVVAFLGVFNGLGLAQAAVRFVAHYAAAGKMEPLRRFLLSSIALILAANVLLGLVLLWIGPALAVRFYRTPALSTYLKLFAVIMVLGALTTFFAKVLQGYRQVSRLTLITDFVGTPLTMLVSVALISASAGLHGYIVAQIVSAVTVLVLLVLLVWKRTPPAARQLTANFSRPESQVVNFSATVLGIGVLSFVVTQTDKVLIGRYWNARTLGVYAVSAAVVAYIPIVLQSVNQIFSPTIADLHTRGQQQLLGRVYQTLTRWVLASSLPLAMVIIVFAKPLMRIFGPDFEAGWPVLIIGAIGQLVNCGVGSVGFLLLMSGNERRLIKVQAVATVVTVVLGLALIPEWGMVGAAVATSATTVLTNSWNLMQVRKVFGFLPYNRRSSRLLFPTVACAVVVVFIKMTAHGTLPAWANVGFALLLAYGTFFTVFLVTGLDADDRLLGRAVRAKMRGILPKIDVEA